MPCGTIHGPWGPAVTDGSVPCWAQGLPDTPGGDQSRFHLQHLARKASALNYFIWNTQGHPKYPTSHWSTCL